MNRQAIYRSFLLRCWSETSPDEDNPSPWRFGLEDSRTGLRRHFADLRALVEFLEKELEAAERQPERKKKE